MTRSTFAASLGIEEHRFAAPADRRVANAIEDALERVETRLHDELRFVDRVADATGRYLLDAGGKRVRPVLTLLTAQLGGGATDEVIRAAAALEITHLASLYHDDVMDEAPTRRGVPAAQLVWGNSIAVLTGDLLFSRASQLIAGLGTEALRMQADTFERLCLGQLHETVGPDVDEDPITHYLGVLADKTGSLIGAASEAGIRFSGGDPALIGPLRLFGEEVGIGFQLVDDVIDLSDDPATGKTAGTDLRHGVATMPLLLLRAEAQAANADAAALVQRLTEPADETAFLAAVADLRHHDATARTRAIASEHAARAVEALAPLPGGPVKRALTEFASRVVERNA